MEKDVVGKKVKIKAIQPIQYQNQVYQPGSVVEVDEEAAKEFCDRRFDTYMPFYGTKPEIGPLMPKDPLARGVIVRAERIS
jgi:hypothetical protein